MMRNATEHCMTLPSLMTCHKCASQYNRSFTMPLNIHIPRQPYVTKQLNPSQHNHFTASHHEHNAAHYTFETMQKLLPLKHASTSPSFNPSSTKNHPQYQLHPQIKIYYAHIRVCDYVRWQLACNNFLQYHVNLQQGYTDFSDVYQVLNMLRHIFDETMPQTGISYVRMHYFSSWLENVCNVLQKVTLTNFIS